MTAQKRTVSACGSTGDWTDYDEPTSELRVVDNFQIIRTEEWEELMRRCDRQAVQEFDYSRLDPEFAKLSKPAKRALINNRIFTVGDLASRTLRDILGFHGIGPSAIPLLRAALRKGGREFSPR